MKRPVFSLASSTSSSSGDISDSVSAALYFSFLYSDVAGKLFNFRMRTSTFWDHRKFRITGEQASETYPTCTTLCLCSQRQFDGCRRCLTTSLILVPSGVSHIYSSHVIICSLLTLRGICLFHDFHVFCYYYFIYMLYIVLFMQ